MKKLNGNGSEKQVKRAEDMMKKEVEEMNNQINVIRDITDCNLDDSEKISLIKNFVLNWATAEDVNKVTKAAGTMNSREQYEKLLDTAIRFVEKEMDRVGFIDDSDNCDRFLDGLARKLVENELVPCGDIDTYNEKEGEIDELSDKLLETIKDNMKYDSYSVNIKGDCLFCYYRNEEGLEEWLELMREGGLL